MTRHKVGSSDYAKVWDAMEAWRKANAEDPEYPARAAAWKQRLAEFMATLDCECTWDACEGNGTTLRCQSDTLSAAFIHTWNCKEAKPWMDHMPRSRDGFELRGSERSGSQYVRRKYTFGFRVPLCPACLSELKRRAAAKSAEARREKRAGRDKDIIMLWDMGKSQRFIAKALECSVGTINGALSRMGTDHAPAAGTPPPAPS